MNQESSIRNTEYSSGELYTLMYYAEQRGAYVGYIRGQLCSTVEDFFREISSTMRFPYYFGWNWAAFDECITDLEWLKFSSIVLVFEDYDMLFERERYKDKNKERLIKYLKAAIEHWASQSIPITIYLN